MNMFLLQEVQRMQRVLAATRSTLQLLVQAIRGEVVMTGTLQRTLDALVDGLPPPHLVRGPRYARCGSGREVGRHRLAVVNRANASS